jgi:hypothetical protein
MAAGPAHIGITEASDTLVQSVEVEKKLSIDVVRKDKDGKFAMAHAADPVSTFSITLLGDSDEEPGTELALSLASLTGGKALVLDKTHKRVNDNFDETTVSGEHYPGATV